MGIIFEIFDGINWLDKTNKCMRISRKITSRSLESLEAELIEVINVGTRIRLKKDTAVMFEGIIYESKKTHRGGSVARCEITSYTDLILFDRHVVFREYATGTKAGAIIKDLASLESGVDVSNVDEDSTPALTGPWQIENEVALKIMQNVAKGTNYWLRMKPNKTLYFKPKNITTSKGTVDGSKVISADYDEDKWRLKNRVIYVGANGQVLADVSEGAGDLPVVVHDPFLTDVSEAQRRANIRLALNKEYGKQLRVEMHQNNFENMNVDLGDTIRVNLPSLGLENVEIFLLEIEYDPSRLIYSLTLGGKLELFEDFLNEAIGGDVAARFGQKVSVVGEVSTIKSTLYFVRKIQSVTAYRFVTYLNRPPLTIHEAENITIRRDTGEAELAAGFTSGYLVISFLPPSQTFRRWGYVEWVSFMNDGSITVQLLDTQNNILASKTDWGSGPSFQKRLYLRRWPARSQEMTKHPAKLNWGSTTTGEVNISYAGLISGTCIRLEPVTQGTLGEIFYPKTKNLGLDISWARYMSIFLLAFSPNTTVKIRLHTDDNNYYEASIVISEAEKWREYVLNINTFTNVGSPDLSNINWISILTNYTTLIDSDYVFHQYPLAELRIRFNLSRPDANAISPKVKRVVVTYEEVMA
ncbi:MAG: hypothetical protein QXQ37_00750 [Nitrososphaerota archaeon]